MAFRTKLTFFLIFISLQKSGKVSFTFLRKQAITKLKWCGNMTSTTDGNIFIWIQTKEDDAYKLKAYDKWGMDVATIPRPTGCNHFGHYLSTLALTANTNQCVAMSCTACQCIWLWPTENGMTKKKWQIGWIAGGSMEKQKQPKPWKMCLAEPGTLVTINGYTGRSVAVFDITSIPFRVKKEEVVLDVNAWGISYCSIPGIGGALAVISGGALQHPQYTLSMYKMKNGEVLWSKGGRKHDTDKITGESVEVEGAPWEPWGLCTDQSKGLIYIGESYKYHRILVFAAADGDILQIIKSPDIEEKIREVLWWEEKSNLVVLAGETFRGDCSPSISYFQKECLI